MRMAFWMEAMGSRYQRMRPVIATYSQVIAVRTRGWKVLSTAAATARLSEATAGSTFQLAATQMVLTTAKPVASQKTRRAVALAPGNREKPRTISSNATRNFMAARTLSFFSQKDRVSNWSNQARAFMGSAPTNIRTSAKRTVE